jgi:hypothetical protein
MTDAPFGFKPAQTPTTTTDAPAPFGFKPAASAPAAPTASSWDDSIMNALTKPATPPASRWASADEGVLPAMRDYGLSAYDAATLGYGVPSALKGAVAQAHQNLGPMDPAAQMIGYMALPGRILGPLAGKVAGAAGLTGLGGSIAAGGLEGAGAGGLGAKGHGGDTGDIVKSALVGGVGGALAGATGGMGSELKVPEVGSPQSSAGPATGMYAKKAQEYAPLDSIYFDNPTTSAALDQAGRTIKAVRDPAGLGADLNVPDDVSKQVGNIYSNPISTGSNLQKASRNLRDSGDWTGHRYADALDNVLNNAQPLQGGQAGEAGAAKLAGDLWHQRIQDLERLGEDPSALTSVKIKQTQQFHKPDSIQGQTLSDLAAAIQPRFNFYAARHMAAPLVGAALGGAEGYLNPAEGQNPWVTAGKEALEGAAIFGGGKALAAARPKSALNAARYAIATGQPMTTATGRVGDYLANLLYGRLAGNQPNSR